MQKNNHHIIVRIEWFKKSLKLNYTYLIFKLFFVFTESAVTLPLFCYNYCT